ncbi:hypothetical protein Tco_0829735 [Tanacetum coccineum]
MSLNDYRGLDVPTAKLFLIPTGKLMVPAGSSWFLLVGFVVPTGLLTVSAASIIGPQTPLDLGRCDAYGLVSLIDLTVLLLLRFDETSMDGYGEVGYFVISNRGRLLGITDLKITKPIRRNEERRNNEGPNIGIYNDNKDDDGQDDDNELTESDNDGDDFIHPKFSTHDEEERQNEEDKEEEGSDMRLDEEETNEEEEVNELYRDVNVNLEGRDTEMTDSLLTNVQTTQVIEDTHAIITAVTPKFHHQSSLVSSDFIFNMLNSNPDTRIDSILNLNTESTSLVDVPVTLNVEMPPSYVTTLPPPPILIQPQQQTPVPTPTIIPSSSLQNLLNFGYLFKFEDKVKALEED